jgi:hypothetical protein
MVTNSAAITLTWARMQWRSSIWRTVPMPGAQNYGKILFLSYNQIKNVLLYFLKYTNVLFVQTTFEFNDEIMKITQGHLNKKLHMKKLSINLLVIKREKQIFNVYTL